jgi:hypothetical protein
MAVGVILAWKSAAAQRLASINSGQVRGCLEGDVCSQAAAAVADMFEENGRAVLVQLSQQFSRQVLTNLPTLFVRVSATHGLHDVRIVHAYTSFCRSLSMAFCFRRVTA